MTSQSQRLEDKFKNIVTGHALVRYLQRVYGFDVNALRNEIIGHNEAMIRNFGNCKITRGDYVLVCDADKIK